MYINEERKRIAKVFFFFGKCANLWRSRHHRGCLSCPINKSNKFTRVKLPSQEDYRGLAFSGFVNGGVLTFICPYDFPNFRVSFPLRRRTNPFNDWHLRNRKHFSCFYQVIKTRVEVWENEKCWGNTSRRRVFPQLFRGLPNFYSVSIIP